MGSLTLWGEESSRQEEPQVGGSVQEWLEQSEQGRGLGGELRKVVRM